MVSFLGNTSSGKQGQRVRSAATKDGVLLLHLSRCCSVLGRDRAPRRLHRGASSYSSEWRRPCGVC
uniref:Uncharacterized protein n=1 Tax=Arundo donax TaxID=35708 RepID=A0A0A9F6K4_ARUDO